VPAAPGQESGRAGLSLLDRIRHTLSLRGCSESADSGSRDFSVIAIKSLSRRAGVLSVGPFFCSPSSQSGSVADNYGRSQTFAFG
jgi:hypothetical protein